MDDRAAEVVQAAGTQTVEETPVAVDDSSAQGRPKRKRAAAKAVELDESDDSDSGRGGDGDGGSDDGSDGEFGAKKATRKPASQNAKSKPKPKPRPKPKPKSKSKSKSKPSAEPSTGAAPRPRRAAADKGAAATAAMAAGDAVVDAWPTASGGQGGGGGGGGGGLGRGSSSGDDIYKRLFAPITDQEIQEWQGWCEIESEPDFFNFILHELGVRNATVQEVYGIDQDTLRNLAHPLGLIFLYKYVEDDEDDQREGAPDSLWFANQTTDNACGTVAMLNIAMNCEAADAAMPGQPTLWLGEHLAQFKAATRDLHPALRGHVLSSDAYIRAKHNSFARRLDMLASDAKLRASWQDSRTQAAAKKHSKLSSKKKTKADKDDAAFHFIAYVPVGSDVWELDGMQEWPLKLGAAQGQGQGQGHWTEVASERIAARMQGYDDEAGFSLLALCGTNDSSGASDGASDGDGDGDSPEHRLAAAAARKRDYTPAVYCWLKKLADKGALRRLATGDDE